MKQYTEKVRIVLCRHTHLHIGVYVMYSVQKEDWLITFGCAHIHIGAYQRGEVGTACGSMWGVRCLSLGVYRPALQWLFLHFRLPIALVIVQLIGGPAAQLRHYLRPHLELFIDSHSFSLTGFGWVNRSKCVQHLKVKNTTECINKYH